MERKFIEIKGIKVPVIYEKDSSLPIISMQLVFRVAGGIQNNNNFGLAKFCEKIMNEGTKKDGVSEFYKKLDMRAISLYVGCGFETFSISLDLLKEHFEFGLKAIKELLSDPNLDKNTIEKLKIITSSEILNLNSDFDYLAKTELNKILYEGSILSHPDLGYEDSLNTITKDEISTFLKENLDLSNLFIVLGGDVDFEEHMLKDMLNSLHAGIPRVLPKFETSSKEIVKQKQKDSKQAYIYFGSPYNVNIDEYYLANVATFILGSSGFGSRLMEEIRVKRGLAYSAYARNSLNLSHKQIWGYLQTKNESKDEALSVVKKEFDEFVKNGVSKKELDMAKKFLLGSEPLRKETLSKRLSVAQSEYYLGQKEGFFDENLKKIANLKLKDLNDYISSHDEITKLSFSIISNEI
ncbi:MAG: pitrilysin family protein [Campylobacter sputorum]|uniref:M16 family metallopeptidase n=1 Tax=Campylobacter sputorum TaxID=206 RepID=UPI000B774BAF|nr:pitrilysin family protein [Campylobacter sputorum]ASM38136.1 peptidase, M16 family [Campylobacter sputorum bv. paraureolyticus LMG 11764]MDY6121284.1 pitrilysin family protein [Campylobacter sputorum]